MISNLVGQGKFVVSGVKLIAGVKELSSQAEGLFAGWTKRILEAEGAYHAAVAGVWQKALSDLN